MDARVKKKIDTLEELLPKYEQAADQLENALQPILNAEAENVRTAVDGARLRIDCIRSVRTIITQKPNYLISHIPVDALANWEEAIRYFLDCTKKESDPFHGATSGVRTVRSPIDGQLLFYVFRLPKDYDPKKRYPLEVSLHSGSGLTWRAGWVDGRPSSDPRKAEKAERIVISPCGRGNCCYAGMGEAAVFEAIQDVQRRYSVDENRVVIGGASMGGTGGFRLGALRPDLFAAVHSLTGGANYSVPKGDGRFDATLLVDNFCNTGVCIWDAANEAWYQQNHEYIESLQERAQQHPNTFPHLELTDPHGKHGVIDRKLQDQGWQWIRQQERDPWPKRVVYKTYCLRYDGAYWAQIDTVENSAAPARIEAELLADGKLYITLDNVARFTLNLAKELVGDVPQVPIIVNGETLSVSTGNRAHFAKAHGKWEIAAERYPKTLVKKRGLSGPVQDVFMGEPVLLVYGTTSDDKATETQEMIDGAVMQLFGQADGGDILHAAFERRADRDVTAEDIAKHHLVLFGSPQQNVFLAKIAGRLPVKFLADGVEISGTAYRGDDIALTLVYPNPLNPDRYVLLLPERDAGGSPWKQPDYVVGKLVTNARGLTQKVLASGSFDAQWSLPR